jgi:uncharacterized membrane protein
MPVQQTRRAPAPEGEAQSSQVSGVEQRDKHYLHQQRLRAARGVPEEKIANFLGWFSIGLGLAEVIAPEAFGKLIGAKGKHTAFIRYACGLREITAGIGILTQRKPAAWTWARVAGDAMDLAALDAAMMAKGTDKARLTAAMAAVVGVAALDVYTAQLLSSPRGRGGAIVAVNTCTINRSPEEVYRFWRNFENLPRFMSHLESVQVSDEKRSHWVARAPMGTTVEWDAEIIEDRPNYAISWRSLEGADVDNRGTVRFDRAPGDRGTEVRVEVEYNPPAGAIGAAVARLFGEAPEEQIKGDLRRLKQVLEIGEVVHSDSSIHAGMHPAQPAADNAA